MKNLLRKLHIGGSPASSSEIPQNRENSTSSSSAVNNNNNNSVAVDNSNSNINNNNSSVDYNYFEEEYQVQLALAISASSSAPDSGGTNDPESLQIKAAKRISLGHFPAPSPASSAVDFLSHRYWSYNVVDYDEKIIDGFYDVYCILSDPNSQGRMPSLVDLQETPVSSNVGYEVVLVNRAVDPVLCQLEEKALGIANDCITAKLSTLIQMVADLVATQMGGPVSDADEMLTKWTMRSYELRTSFNNIVLPLGCLQIGLSRHRALLFKVLADCVGIPCRLVKGSYYTGTDDGAVNFIKLDSEREFIIDLMGAPGALIPTETPSIVSSSKPAKESNNADQQIIAQAVQTLCSALEEKDPCQPLDKKESENLHQNCGSGDSNRKNSTSEFLSLGEFNVRENSSNESLQSSYVVPPIERTKMVHSRPRRSPSWTGGTLMSEQMKVNDMSQYVLNAANENPEFAQKLHDVLLESGVSPPLNFFDSINSLQGIGEQNLNQQKSNFFEAKRISDAIKCGEKIESGPGRPPRPAAVQNNLISNTANENLLNEFLPNARAKMISACSAPLIEFPTSDHASASLFPGFPAIDTSKLSSDISSAAGQSQNSAGQQIFPLPAAFAASASVVDSSVVVATNKCDDLASSRLAVETYADTSLVNDRISLVKCGYNKDREGSSGSEGKFSRSRDSSSLLEENNVLDDVNECEIPWEDLQTGERIGLGSYGEVYHAEWNGTEVAVKKFLDQAFSGDALEQFRSEVRIMRRLRHPNIVLFMGAVTRPPNLSILTEFLPRGSLYRLLHRSNVNLDEKRRLRMALDVAKGMNYLHTSNPVIVHRDLKSPNLLVDKNWVVKVCDFGLSRLKHHTFLSSKSTAGTPEWMAPEVLRNEPANEKCDVYSFGVILWELATLRMPWSGMNPMQVVGAVGFQNRRLEIPTEVDQPVAQIIANCWQNDPSLRPSFGQLMISLKSLQRLLVSPL